ncbi:hypothetical protein [Halobellus captivus]|uniref:hypothetical protein n=1 Tax=Halobellus captivus TaxID=2592614 RepID=UPI0011AA3D0B|nr:hypothetical protein [Halobellus captivus]
MSETNENSTQRTQTRRTALKVFGGLLGAGTTSAVGLGVFTQRGSATVNNDDFTAQDVTLESDDGTVTEIWLQPDLTYSWSGLNSSPTETEFIIEVSTPDGGVAELGRETDDEVTTGTSGTDAYTFANRLTLISDGPWSASDFKPGTDDTETFGPITVTVTANLKNGDDDSPYVDSASAEFTVTVTDSAVRFGDSDSHGIEGEAQTGGSAGGSETGSDGGDADSGGETGGGGGDDGSDGNGADDDNSDGESGEETGNSGGGPPDHAGGNGGGGPPDHAGGNGGGG